MIRLILFDLDGTLVQTEKLKPLSYAIAVQRLRGLPKPDQQAIEAYRTIVGASREAASRFIADQLNLEPELRPLMTQHEAGEPWQVLTALRVAIYDEMVADPMVLRDHQWPHTVGLLRTSRETGCRTALATMSYRKEALHVLRVLDLEKTLDLILTREDVSRPKPDPEIYLLGAHKLGVPPTECLVLEDSATGTRAAVAAGMNVIALATPFTSVGLHESQVVDHAWVVHQPEELLEVVRLRIEEHNRQMHTHNNSGSREGV